MNSGQYLGIIFRELYYCKVSAIGSDMVFDFNGGQCRTSRLAIEGIAASCAIRFRVLRDFQKVLLEKSLARLVEEILVTILMNAAR